MATETAAGRPIVRALPAALVAISLLSFLVRLTVRDRWPVASTLFYATPPAVPACLLAVATAAWAGRRKRRPALVAGAMALVSAVWFAAGSWRIGGRPDREGRDRPVRLLLWNVSWGRPDWERLAREAEPHQADVLALVETGSRDEDPDGWREHFAGHRVAAPGGGLRILTRGEIESAEFRRLAEGSDAARASIDVGGRRFEIVLVDLWANPFASRDAAFESLGAWVMERPAGTMLVLGDFNTPPESVHFERLRETFREAFDTAGDGYEPTWPLPLPVLALDQVWCGAGIEVRRAEHLWTTASDHRPVLVEFSVAE